MSEEVLDRDELKPPPQGPRLGGLIAVTLELAMLGVFAYDKRLLGLMLWLAYFWFSATWSFTLGWIERRYRETHRDGR